MLLSNTTECVVKDPGLRKKPKMDRNPTDTQVRKRIDSGLLERIREQQDQRALAQLFEYYAPRLKSWLMGRGLSEAPAEDLIQDVMITVWTRADRFDPSKAAFSTWLFRVTRNRWIDRTRKHGRMLPTDPEHMRTLADEMQPSIESQFIVSEAEDDIRERLATLPAKQRNLVEMAFMQHKTHVEISDQTGIPLGTVKTRIRTALKTLKMELEDNEA